MPSLGDKGSLISHSYPKDIEWISWSLQFYVSYNFFNKKIIENGRLLVSTKIFLVLSITWR